jgi:hypothetical protein
MSILKFELKKNHLDLLKYVEWKEVTDTKNIVTNGNSSPFGGLDHYEDMGVILFGMPEDFDPFEGNPFEWTYEQKVEMDELLNELPLALEVVLSTQSFIPGIYKSRFHIRDWVQIGK